MAQNIQGTIQMVKSYFENYEISEADLLRPKSEFVTKFYWDFLNEIGEHFNTVAKCEFTLFGAIQADDIHVMLIQLNDILRKLNDVNSTLALKMTLGDLYAPTSQRTRMFIFIFIHFLIFLGSAKYVKHTIPALQQVPTQDELLSLSQKNDEKINIINDNAAILSELKETKIKLEKNISEANEKLKNLVDNKNEKDLLLSSKRIEIEKLQWQKEHLRDNLLRLETKEKRLREQVVTEEDYKQLQKILSELDLETQEYENLEKELGETLDSMKQTISTFQNRLAQINSLNINKDNIELLEEYDEKSASLKSELKSIEEAISLLSLDCNKKESEVKNLILCIEKFEKTVEASTKQHEDFKKDMRTRTASKSEEKMQIAKKLENNIAALKNDIEEIQQNTEKLLKGCAKKYNQYAIEESKTTLFFSNKLTEAHELLREAVEEQGSQNSEGSDEYMLPIQ